MEKESKISFRGLEMNLKEAKNYLADLKSGKINVKLNEREQERYNEIKDILKLEDERSYLELLLTIPIVTKEKLNRETACEKKGHPGEEVLSIGSSGKAFCICKSCGVTYERYMNHEEYKELREMMNTPYNI
jgi:hypothetical protein